MNRPPTPFSQLLDNWLASKKPKTIAGLMTVSSEKSFAIIFMVLMAIPALPLPTGGVTHVFEIITALVALELVAGRRTVWLPSRWLHRPLGNTLEKKTLPYLSRKIAWLEKHSRPRWGGLLRSRAYLRLVGLAVIVLTAGAFLAPPFSGLDTIPALGVVGVALSLILDDFVIFAAGFVVGIFGIVLEISLGAAIVTFIQRTF
ncbi:MAG: exopolysaccharide biosynthesis protein [Candidatus Saccharibacteria bacterium]